MATATLGMSIRMPSSSIVMACSSLDDDSSHLLRATELAQSSAGVTAPHPNFGCVIARGQRIVGEGFLYAQGTKSAEVQAVERAGEAARGATAYLNLEPGDCAGDDAAIKALGQAQLGRVVVGMRHPLSHFQGKAIDALRGMGTRVDADGEELKSGYGAIAAALDACKVANAPLLYRATEQLPMSTLKYAMTLDGKIAASSGHAAWVSSALSRQRVFKTRAESDAVVVGGNTVRRDNPSLTTRKDDGHQPARIVMSRCLDLPTEANLWDVSKIETIVVTQKGANKEFQRHLAAKGVEVVEFDFLDPRAVMEYCYSRGYLSVMWECGGMLSAPAIQAGVIHKVMAFIAPKIVGGLQAPTPVGELGMVQMTQALNLSNVSFEQVGPDMLVTGFLHSPFQLETVLSKEAKESNIAKPSIICFNKAWDLYGAFSNYSHHPITLVDSNCKPTVWNSVEHFYQAQKFQREDDEQAVQIVNEIQNAASPEEAGVLGRTSAQSHPNLVRDDWDDVKFQIMYKALQAKFSSYSALRSLLISTEDCILVNTSQYDLFWGTSRTGVGFNQLGQMLMDLREDFQGGDPSSIYVNGHGHAYRSGYVDQSIAL